MAAPPDRHIDIHTLRQISGGVWELYIILASPNFRLCVHLRLSVTRVGEREGLRTTVTDANISEEGEEGFPFDSTLHINEIILRLIRNPFFCTAGLVLLV